MADEIGRADEATLARLVKGTQAHGLGRLQEMEAPIELLHKLGVEPVMTTLTEANLRKALENWPDPKNDSGADGRSLPKWWNKI
ncbi:MAG: DUF1932 domain-containing protein [Gammaproteobacteria bacterium]|nr:DUF1932 domain-containing protein [Gammaproteobacteria bacterium]MDH3537223.1 DUF1932 domain-containing protein [Gammaproteobacteria bacterium]